jgi:O-antigen/teichoic acid export membrane protein
MARKMVSVKKKIIKNTLANTFMKLWRYGVNFFLLPFIILHIGVADYGLYLLVGAFVGYFGLLDLGVGASLVKYVAEYNAKGDKEMINKMVNSTFVFYLGVGVAVCVGIMFIGYVFVDFFKIEEGSVNLARGIAAMVAIGALTSWPIRSFSTSLEGMQRYDLTVLVDFIIVTINGCITIVLLLSGYGIVELIFFGIIVGAIEQISKVWLVQRMMPFLILKREYMGMVTMRKIFKFSSVVFVTQITIILMMGLDRVIIGFFVGVAAITFYYIVSSLYEIINTASSLPSSALLPAVSDLVAKGDEKTLKLLAYRGGKYRAAAILPITASIIILAKDILRFWMGINYIWLAPYVQLFVSLWFITATWGILGTMLLAREKYRPVLKINIANCSINLVLSILLTYYLGWIGVLLGTLLGWVFISPWVMKAYLQGNNIPGYDYFKKSVLPAYFPLSAMIITLLVSKYFIMSINPIMLIVNGFLGFGVYFSIFYFKGLTTYEKTEIKTVLHSFLTKIKISNRV